MKYLVLVNIDIFKKLNEKPDWESVWLVDEEMEESLIEGVNSLHDSLIENTLTKEE